ncbi:hypothetical protein Tco_0332248 [Tanacetum coccineum]
MDCVIKPLLFKTTLQFTKISVVSVMVPDDYKWSDSAYCKGHGWLAVSGFLVALQMYLPHGHSCHLGRMIQLLGNTLDYWESDLGDIHET